MSFIKCDPRVYARCPTRESCEIGAEYAKDSECAQFAESVLNQPATNADRIRAMNDEELATMLFDYKECNKNCIMSSGKHCHEICEEESVILKWLQQPAEED